MARPRSRLGKISENMAHMTGPKEIAKAAMYPMIAAKTTVARMFKPVFTSVAT